LIGRHYLLGNGLLETLVLAGATGLQTGRKNGSIAATNDEHQGQTDP
jgi:hypothetical protein